MLEFLFMLGMLGAFDDRRTPEQKKRDARREKIKVAFYVMLFCVIVGGCTYGIKLGFEARDRKMYNLGVQDAQESKETTNKDVTK